MRLFIGLAPDAAARAALSETARILKAHTDGRFADPILYHITLAFLGELDVRDIPTILSAMRRAGAAEAPFSVQLAALHSFGSVLWRGVAPEEDLRRLANCLREELSRHSIPFDPKPFRAHITLVREASLPREPLAARLPDAAYPVCQMTLFESIRARGALQYVPRGAVPLTKLT